MGGDDAGREEHLLKEFQSQLALVDEGRYQVKKIVGRGSYGLVGKAYDTVDKQEVAIKVVLREILNNAFTVCRTSRELMMLAHFNHPNIIGLKNVLVPPGDFQILFQVMDIMATDLKAIMSDPEQSLSEDHAAYFVYQALRALFVVHEAGIVHRDVHPSNFLVNGDCTLRLCDFGLARDVDPDAAEGGGSLTDYVCLRFYRAPELILGQKDYDPGVDVWSVGCIMAELLGGKRPFFKGSNPPHQLSTIIAALGTPSEEDLQFISAKQARNFITTQVPKAEPADWSKLFPNASPEAVDLVSRMLVFNPKKRMTVREALAHPWFEGLEPHFCGQDVQHGQVNHIVEGLKKFEMPYEMNWKKEKLADLKKKLYDACITIQKNLESQGKRAEPSKGLTVLAGEGERTADHRLETEHPEMEPVAEFSGGSS